MDGVQSDDEDIVVLLGKGDDRGLELLYERYSRLVYSLTLKIVQNQQVAEELTQEVFVRVWQQSATFRRERGRFATWLLGIAHHIAVDEIRRRKARPQQVHENPQSLRPAPELADAAPEPAEQVLGGIRREYIVEALSRLPDTQREVIELSYFGGLTQSQIAERKGEPLGTIKTRTRLALNRLRMNLLAQGIKSDTL